MTVKRLFILCAVALCACASDQGFCQHGLTVDGIPCSSKGNSAYADIKSQYEPTDWLTASFTWGLDYINKIKQYFAGTPSQNVDYGSMFYGISENEVNDILSQAGNYAKDIHAQQKANPNIDLASIMSGVFGNKDGKAKDDIKHSPQSPPVDEIAAGWKQVEMMAKSIHGDNERVESLLDNLHSMFEEKPEIEGNKDDEFPQSARRKPGNVGDVTVLELGNGETRDVVTLSISPPIFEIDNFLSDEECDYIIEKSLARGLHKVGTFKDKITVDQKEHFDNARVSDACHLSEEDMGKQFTKALHEKVARLVDMPMWVVAASEHLDIKRYQPGGHYHAHLDSSEPSKRPCCFQQECLNADGKDSMNADCCKCCRYATALYYLNDVEEGGETVFPFADLEYSKIHKLNEAYNWRNLSKHCHDAEIVVKPKKGKAIFWYNNFLDKHGYLGGVDQRSFHGGCDVIKGTKWIATNWIAAPNYPQRFQKSKYLDDYTYLKD